MVGEKKKCSYIPGNIQLSYFFNTDQLKEPTAKKLMTTISPGEYSEGE